MTDTLRHLETLEAEIRGHARAHEWITWHEDLTAWASRLAEIRAALAAGGSVASEPAPCLCVTCGQPMRGICG